jgi:hypothetical protein
VDDALSQQHEEDGTLFSLSLPIPDWIEDVCQEWLTHLTISRIIQHLQEDPNPPTGYAWHENTLRYKDLLVISPSSTLKLQLLTKLHSLAIAGHSGFQTTYAHARRSFFCIGMKKDIPQFVTKCEVCQRNKGETIKSLGSLQPLPIPTSMWTDISMDFMVGLPKVWKNSFIMVVVDHLSNYAHFCALPHPFTATLIAQVFLDHIFKLHGMPTSIVYDRDPNFTSTFW